MLKFVVRRALAVIPLIIIATAATFFMLQLSDADPAVMRLGESATDAQYAEVRAELGTDRPGGGAVHRLARPRRAARLR